MIAFKSLSTRVSFNTCYTGVKRALKSLSGCIAIVAFLQKTLQKTTTNERYLCPLRRVDNLALLSKLGTGLVYASLIKVRE